MGTSYNQDRNFISHLIDDALLESAIEWIQSNMEPEDVFSDSDLSHWAKDNGYVEEDE